MDPLAPTLALLNPTLLWAGIGLVSVPILIHLFFRRRHRVVRWAAMQFLLAAVRKQQRRIRFENLLLLLLRCAMIAVLGLALARPTASTAALAPLAGVARSIVLVVDTSSSMAAEQTGRSAIDRARERAGVLLGSLPSDAVVTLIATRDELAGGTPRALIERAAPADVRARLAGLGIASGPNRLGEVFRLAQTALERMSGRKLVVLVTDLQQRDWRDAGGARREDVARALGSITAPDESGAPGAAVTVLDVGAPDRANVVVDDLTLEEGREAFAGQLVGLGVTLINYGPDPTAGTLTLYQSGAGLDGWEKKEALSVTVPPTLGVGNPVRTLEQFHVPLPRDAEGPARFRVSFTPALGTSDRLSIDNERFLALRVRPPVRFLPVQTVHGSLDILRDVQVLEVIEFAEPVSPAALSTLDLSRYDVVLWADPEIGGLDERGRDNLEAFVRRGGGFLAYLGVNADPERVNALFHRERGEGLFPMLLDTSPIAMQFHEDQPTRFAVAASESHPLFREAALFGSPLVFGWRPVREYPEEAVVARYENGEPAVLEHRLGEGRVVVVTTTPDERAFTLNGSLLPAVFFYNAAQYLVAQDPASRNVSVGHPIRVALQPGARSVVVEPPEAAGGQIQEPVADPSKPFVFTATAFPGFYRIAVQGLTATGSSAIPTETVHVAAVNVEAEEGDLRAISPHDLQDARAYGRYDLGFTSDVEEVMPTRGSDRGEWSRALLAAVLVLMVVELLLAWRFGSRRRSEA